METRNAVAVGGGRTSTQKREGPMHDMKALELLWKILIVILRYGNIEICYHICAGGDRDGESWKCPMNAENVEVREGYCGKYVTIF